jgi:hypothetical protein
LVLFVATHWKIYTLDVIAYSMMRVLASSENVVLVEWNVNEFIRNCSRYGRDGLELAMGFGMVEFPIPFPIPKTFATR